MATTRHNQECVSCGQNIPPRSEINKCAVCLGAMHEDCGHKCVCDNKVCDEHWAGDCCTACIDALKIRRRELELQLQELMQTTKAKADEIGKEIDTINKALE